MNNNSLYNHGILGQKWGIRRYQNEDGTLTEAGKKRYTKSEIKENVQKYYKQENKYLNKINKANKFKNEIDRKYENKKFFVDPFGGNEYERRVASGKISNKSIREHENRWDINFKIKQYRETAKKFVEDLDKYGEMQRSADEDYKKLRRMYLKNGNNFADRYFNTLVYPLKNREK